MPACVIADSGPLIAIASADALPLLVGVFAYTHTAIWVPRTVWAECTATRDPTRLGKPGSPALLAARRAHQLKVIDDTAALQSLGDLPPLDAGETAAIAMALQTGSPLLIDERLGRDIARRRGVTVVGSAGVLLQAKNIGLVKAIAPVLARMQTGGYFLSAALLAEVLRRAGEHG
jgi:uncharacterized protein